MMNIKGMITLIFILIVADLAIAFGFSPVITRLVAEAVHKNSDYEVRIKNVRLHPLLLSVQAQDVELFDERDTSRRMFYGRGLSARLDPWALLAKRVSLQSLTLKEVELEVVKNASGEFNIENIGGTETGPQSKLDKLKGFFGHKKDWFGNLYERIKSGLRNKKTDPKSGDPKPKIKKDLKILPRGKSVRFSSPRTPLFEIKKLKLSGGKINLSDQGSKLPPLENIQIHIKRLKVSDAGRVSMKLVRAKGDFITKRKGSFDVSYKAGSEDVEISAKLKDVDMAALKTLYEDSLPVSFSEGYLELDSTSRLEPGSLSSENHLRIDSFVLTPGNPFSLSGLSTKAIVEVLNTRPEFRIDFTIGGTPDKPSFGGFKDTLMNLIKDDLAGAGTWKNKASDALSATKDKLKNLL